MTHRNIWCYVRTSFFPYSKLTASAGGFRDVVNKVNDLIKDITEKPDVAQDMLDNFYTSVSFGVEFDEVQWQ